MRISFRTSWVLAAVLALLFAVVVAHPIRPVAAELSKEELAKEQRYGKYGGPFTLLDHNGKTVTDADFQGRYLLVFFGYTFCPDVCPTAMQTVSDTLDLLGDAGKTVQPLFITFDPERDTPEILADFVGNFHPRILGLTGTKEQIRALTDDYGVQYYKVFAPPSFLDETQGEDEDTNYLISHSAATYLMGPDGKFITYFANDTSPDEMAKQIRKILDPQFPR